MRKVNRIIVLALVLGLLPFAYACDNGGPPYNPKVPLIESIVLSRGGENVTDATVYTGELITVTVIAEAQSVIGDCYTPTGDESAYGVDLTEPTPLDYTFQIIPPAVTDRTGGLTQDDPPGSIAQWRVPSVDDVPGHEIGLAYVIQVTCFDDCLDLTTIGKVAVQVFSDKGPPSITSLDAATRPGGNGTYALEEKDLNGYYEVEPADEVRVRVTAESLSDPSLCIGLNITPARSLHYLWQADSDDVNITGEPDPADNKTIYFDVPEPFTAGDIFTVTLTVLDTCSDAETIRLFHFLVVEPPIITTWTILDNGYEVEFNLYSGFYEVLAGGSDEIVANAENADATICAWKGYALTRSYSWSETLGTSPSLDLVFEPLPQENFRSRLTFIAPAVANGTKYKFRFVVTDRCNGLSTSMDFPFLIIVPPTLGTSTVNENSSAAAWNQITGRYEVHVGSTISVIQEAASNCSSSFCAGRGVEADESLEYGWADEMGFFDLVYEPVPVPNDESTVYAVVPPGAVGNSDTLTVTVTDLCNGLSVTRDFIFEVVG